MKQQLYREVNNGVGTKLIEVSEEEVKAAKEKYDNPCLSYSHTDIMYCHNCIHYLGRYRIN